MVQITPPPSTESPEAPTPETEASQPGPDPVGTAPALMTPAHLDPLTLGGGKLWVLVGVALFMFKHLPRPRSAQGAAGGAC